MSDYETLKQILVEKIQVPNEVITPDTAFKDIDFDSLAAVELTIELERIGVVVSDAEILSATTVGALAELIASRALAER